MIRRLGAARAHDCRGGQLLALLLVAVVVPSACVLWFMNEAVTNQAAAARRPVVDAYRGQLRLLRGRLTAYWQSRAAELESKLTRHAADDFKLLVTSGAAGSVVVLGPDGAAVYPSLAVHSDEVLPRALSDSTPARAAQVLVRDLVRRGDTRAAIEAINRHFLSGPAAGGADQDGRLIAADEQLLLINLLTPSDQRRGTAVQRLAALLTTPH